MWNVVVFRIGDIQVTSALLIVAVSYVSVLALSGALLLKRFGLRSLAPLLIGAIGSVIGARIVGAWIFGGLSIGESLSRWAPEQSPLNGTSVMGGYFGAILAFGVASQLVRIPVRESLGLLSAGLCVSQISGRFGCMAAGCCFGTPTSMPWGIRYPLTSATGLLTAQMNVHPAPLYEAALCVPLSLLVWRYVRRPRYSGQPLVVFLIGYGLVRFFVQFFRADAAYGPLYLSPAHGFALSFVVVGFLLHLAGRRTDCSDQ